ncbi:TonB-dependent receptor [candidate division KSB1 bacterium]|nr:TonB-dependent receptor [candidate division KSB1 bacterium]RQW01250.1 MAG: TonB-dependent receptor [candidate division KSB1 bacterium]
MKHPLLTLTTLTIVLFCHLHAQSGADSVKYRFDPVVVTATKVEGAQSDIAASVSVVDAKMIQQSISSSALELVKDHVPGVFITERAVMGYGVAYGAAGGISIRGVGGSPVTGVLVLRDGRPDIMGMMGHPLPDAYSLEGLERIEVVRGPASFLYGTNAMGGVINLVSKKVRQDGFQTKIRGGLGNYNSGKLYLNHGGKIGPFDYFVTLGTQRTDGHRENSNYDGTFSTVHLGYAFSAKTKLELNANYSDVYLLDPGTIDKSAADQWYDIRRSGADVTLNHSSRLGDSYVKLHGNFGHHKIYDGWRSNDQTIGLMMYHNAALWAGNTTTAGFDYKRYGGDAEESLNQVPFIDYSERFMTEWAPYIHMQQLFWQRFIASAGLRVEQHELYGAELLPKIGLVTNAAKSTAIRLSAAKGFRSPSIRELYVFPPRNEELLPENLWNYELGITQGIGTTAHVEVVLFQARGSNLIRQDFSARPSKFVNSGEFTHAGYEIAAKWRPITSLNVSASWSDINLGNETQGAPEKKLSLYAAYDFGRIELMTTIMHAAELYGSDARQNKLPDYTLINVATNIAIWKTMGLKLSLKNALDQEYQTLYGYPMPGRTFMAEIVYSF